MSMFKVKFTNRDSSIGLGESEGPGFWPKQLEEWGCFELRWGQSSRALYRPC